MSVSLDCRRFVVAETPCCIWDYDLKGRNLEFIHGLNPEFFEYVVAAHEKELAGDQRQCAALALRAAYLQGLETLFAVLFAALQAPDCVVGWMPRYRQDDLLALVLAICQRRPIRSKVKLADSSWQGISEALHRCCRFPDPSAGTALVHQVATLWSRFARDFLDDTNRLEYNSIKHGLRARPGGFQLHIAPSGPAGAAAPSHEQYQSLGGSEFGSSFFVPQALGAKGHFRLRRASNNWHPTNHAHGLRFIAQSIRNLLTFLRLMNGDSRETLQIAWPANMDEFSLPWALRIGVGSCSMDFDVQLQDIDVCSEREILSVYPTRVGDGPSGDGSPPPSRS